jgi:tryptophan synthase alpha chain
LRPLAAAFARRRALVAYLPLGDPRVPPGLAELYAECGVDVIEIGVPAREPFLDGPTVAASMGRALEAGAADVAGVRAALPQQPLVWMGYPERSQRELARAAVETGMDGVLVPVPARTLAPLREGLEAHGLDLVHFLGAPPDDADVAEARNATAYVMVQATPGLTGARERLGTWAAQLGRLREAGVTAPLAVGFGIASPDQAREAVELGANGVVVGSALVEAALAGEDAVRRLLGSLREALDGA